MEQYYLKVSLNKEIEEIQHEVVIHNSENQGKLEFYSEQLGCKDTDVINTDPGLDIVIDEEGLEINHNPIFNFRHTDMTEDSVFAIAGTFLVGIYDGEGGTDGYSSLDSLLSNLDGKVQTGQVGYTD